MAYQGKIQEVSIVPGGDQLAEDAASGATLLYLNDLTDFDDDGGQIELAGTVYNYTELDLDDDSMVLASPLLAAAEADTPVYQYPYSEEKWAIVSLEDEEEPKLCRIPHYLQDQLEDGIRPDPEQETAMVDLEDDDFVVINVIGRRAKTSGEYLAPDTIPPPTPIPPTVSPIPVATGGIGRIFVVWSPDTTATAHEVEVHISTVADFIPSMGDLNTLSATVNGTMATISSMPDGTALVPGTVYYVSLIARQGGVGAPPSEAVPAELRQITTEDISVNAAWVGSFSFDQAIGGTLRAEALLAGAGGFVAQGAAGEEVSLRGSGFFVRGPSSLGNPLYVQFPTDGAQPNIISGTLTTDTVTITQGATFRGSSFIEAGANLRLGGKLNPPKSAPSVSTNYHTVTLKDAVGSSVTDVQALCKGHGGYWIGYSSKLGAMGRWNDDGTLIDTVNPALHVVMFSRGLVYDATANLYYTLNWRASRVSGGAINYYSYIYTLDTNFALVGDDPFLSTVTAVPSVIGWDHVNNRPLTAYVTTAGIQIKVLTRDVSNVVTGEGSALQLAGTSAAYNELYPNSDGLAYVARVPNTSDIAADRYIVRTDVRGDVSVTTDYWVADTAGAAISGERWPSVTVSSRTRNAWYNTTDQRWWDLGGDGLLRRYESNGSYWTTGTGDRYLGYTWYDSTGTAHESAMSPRAKFTQIKRSRMSVTIDPIPSGLGGVEDPNSARIYAVNQSTDPGAPAGGGAGPFSHRGTISVPLISMVLDPAFTPGSGPGIATDFPNVNNPGGILSQGGGSYWYGDDTAKFLKLIVDSSTDVNLLPNNRPPLIVGNPVSNHLRLDGNEIQGVTSDDGTTAVAGNITLNATGGNVVLVNGGGTLRIGPNGDAFKGVTMGQFTGTTDANSRVSIDHRLTATPSSIQITTRNTHIIRVFSSSSTSFSVEVASRTGTGPVGTGVSVIIDWVAWLK